jgi:hypothetical protein
MSRFTRRLVIGGVAFAAALGIVAMPIQAQADTTWKYRCPATSTQCR